LSTPFFKFFQILFHSCNLHGHPLKMQSYLCAKEKWVCANSLPGAIIHLYKYSFTGGILLLIHRMTATFGKLQNRTLELKDGLNILQAPNETGKSTWCAFLLSMFYGINSREREKAGFIPDKIRYAPWSGAPMSGRLECTANEGDLTLTRSTRRQTAPMGEFKAVYTGTGDPVPELTGSTCGEALLGVNREIFERSAFIRQSGLAISQDASLERRIASLITSGEEEVSYSEAADILKKQLNRRRHNKTGQLPALEAELQTTLRQITLCGELEQQLKEALRRAEELSAGESLLTAELDHHKQWELLQKQRALTQAAETARQAESRAAALQERLATDQIPESETIIRLRGAIVNLETTRKQVERAREARDEAAKALLRAEAALNESPFVGQAPEAARKTAAAVPPLRAPNPLFSILLVVLGAAAGLAAGLAIAGSAASWYIAAGGGVGLLAALLELYLRATGSRKKQAAYLHALNVQSAEELNAQLEHYLNRYAAFESAQADLNAKSAAAEALYNTLSSNEQAILLEIRRFAPTAFDIPTADALLRECGTRRKQFSEAASAAEKARMYHQLLLQEPLSAEAAGLDPHMAPPLREKRVVSEELSQLRGELAQTRSAADRLSGQLHAAGDPVVLRSAAEQLSGQIDALEAEYTAIRLAMDTLEHANTTLQNRFSPELGRRTAEIFGELTDGRYSGVVLDRAFHLSAEPQGDALYRDAGLLSAGTVDQLYLSARLAICDLALPKDRALPIVLDDALANFDDRRCAAALRWLKQEAQHRQILLLTCHSREAEFFAGDEEVFIQQLTETI